MLRTIYFYLGLIISLIFSSIYRIRIKILTNKGDIEGRKYFIHKVSHSWGKFIMKISGAKINVIGLDNLPKSNCIICI